MSTPSGLFRRELYVDARDLQSDSDPETPMTAEEYTAVLTTRGKEKLAENQLVQSFNATVKTRDSTYEYGKDFYLGDTITVTDERLGVSVNAIIQGVERSVGRDSETMSLILGYAQPTIYEFVQRKAAK